MIKKVLTTPDRAMDASSKMAELTDVVFDRSNTFSISTDEAPVKEKRYLEKKWSGGLEDFEIRGRWGYNWYGDIFLIKNRRQGNVSCVLKTTRVYRSNQWPLRFELAALSELKHENLLEVQRAFVRYGVLFTVYPAHINVEDIVSVKNSSNLLSNILPGFLSTTMSMPVLNSLIGQFYRAIIFLHQNDLMHLDLKPSNLVLTEDGTLKLCDLAVSQQLAASEFHEFHRLAESQRFVAPEIALNKKFDRRADTWCFALCCIQLVYGLRPYEIADIDFNGTISPLVSAIKEKQVPLDWIYRHAHALERSMPMAMSLFIQNCLIGRASRRPLLSDFRDHEFIRGCHVDRELLVRELLTDSLRSQYHKQRAKTAKQQNKQLDYNAGHAYWIKNYVNEMWYRATDDPVIHIIALEPRSSQRRELEIPLDQKFKIRLLDEELRHRLYEWLDDRTFSLHNYYQLATKVLDLFADFKRARDERFYCTTLVMHPEPNYPAVEVDCSLNEVRGHEFVYLVYIADAQWIDETAEWLKSTEHYLFKAGYCKEGVVKNAYRRLRHMFKTVK
ncbi:hypothetical protein M3Y95_01189400 [Aphelenchoides besseyi]|nr:hypothetical protein M3Y95_01189400 [Aphelenchoides besseyi]